MNKLMRQLFVGLAIAVASDDTYFLPALQGKTGPVVAFVQIQGASCPPAAYKPMLNAIQKACPFPLWIGVPEYIGDTPEPVQFGSKVDDVLSRMEKAGMAANHSVISAHSLGGVMAQTYLASNAHKMDALILMGATLLRKYRNDSFPVPILTVDGELDGLLHITRQAEAYFHQVQEVGQLSAAIENQPVVILEGLNHWSFGSGTPPSNVAKNDLAAEVTPAAGYAMIAKVISDYLIMKFGTGGAKASAITAIEEAVKDTGIMLSPLIEAMQLEGHQYLKQSCDSDYPTNPTCGYTAYPGKSLGPPHSAPNPAPPSDCTCGSPWVMGNAQRIMGGLEFSANPGATIATKDAFHDVSQTRPFHLPHIFTPKPGTACKAGATCQIESTTVTMPIYDSRDSLDTGLYPITATEFRTKLKSRQAVWEAAGATGVNYTATDRYNTSICQAINQAAYNWALSKAAPKTLKRFQTKGQPYVFVPDQWSGIGITGPEWIKAAMVYTPSADKKTVTVAAPYFACENKNLGDEPYTDTVGYHYCKLLSPARAMEWLYADGLRQFGGINKTSA
jgi:hypothetical protein